MILDPYSHEKTLTIKIVKKPGFWCFGVLRFSSSGRAKERVVCYVLVCILCDVLNVEW